MGNCKANVRTLQKKKTTKKKQNKKKTEWNLSLIKDIELLEQVKHRATKLIPEIAHLPYHERLKLWNIQKNAAKKAN